jgi:hypothetical protein
MNLLGCTETKIAGPGSFLESTKGEYVPANFEPNPQDPWVKGIADEIELDGLLSLASALQARHRCLEDDSCSEVTPEHQLSDGCHISKNP